MRPTLLPFSHPLEDERTALLPCPSTPMRFPTLCSEQGKHLSVLTNLNQGGSQAQQPCLGIPSPLKGLSIHLPLGQPWTGL